MKAFVNSKVLFVFCASLILVSLFSCTKNEFPDPNSLTKELEGSWVEVDTKTDTIIFLSSSNTGIFWLHRGYEIRNGYRLPIIGSTGYRYEIIKDSIKVVDGLSSAMSGGTYFFNFDKPNLIIRIGKFSQYIYSSKPILTFRKIK